MEHKYKITSSTDYSSIVIKFVAYIGREQKERSETVLKFLEKPELISAFLERRQEQETTITSAS